MLLFLPSCAEGSHSFLVVKIMKNFVTANRNKKPIYTRHIKCFGLVEGALNFDNCKISYFPIENILVSARFYDTYYMRGIFRAKSDRPL